MLHDNPLTTAAIQAAFSEEITAMGGTVKDVFNDGERLFARSILTRTREVVPRDRVQDGVALRATEGEICVHPYTFRQVCSNGAIIVQSVQSRRIEDLGFLDPDEAESAVREAVRACCAEESFEAFAAEMRSASEERADRWLVNLMPMLSRLPQQDAPRILAAILERFTRDADSSRFGLMNAVTSVARDTTDPDLRWRLEELGGGIPAGRDGVPSSGGGRAKRAAGVLQAIA